MTEEIILPEKSEESKNEYNSTRNEAFKIAVIDYQCESKLLFSSPCLLAEIEEDEDLLKR